MRVQVAVGEPTESQPFSPPPAPLLSSQRRTGRVRPRPLPQLRRCSLKPPLRTKSVGTKVSEPEFAALETRARASGLTLSEWVRDVLLASSPEAGAAAADQVLLGELLALRTILINLLFSVSKGEPVTPEQMQALIERADKDKMRRALERLGESRLTVPSGAGTTEEMER